MITFYWYPKCGTCKKAKKWLEDHHVEFTTVDMIKEVPSQAELAKWIEASELPLRRFFNTSGMKYRELGLKEKVPTYTDEEAAAVLATDGMLIKRPIIVQNDQVLTIGFKEKEYEGAFI